MDGTTYTAEDGKLKSVTITTRSVTQSISLEDLTATKAKMSAKYAALLVGQARERDEYEVHLANLDVALEKCKVLGIKAPIVEE